MLKLFSNTFKILYLLFFVSTISQNANAQIGVTGAFTTMNAPNWQKSMSESIDYRFASKAKWKVSYKVGIDFYVKFPDYKIFFLPSIYYSKFKQFASYNFPSPFTTDRQFNVNIISASINTNIYFLDIKGDYHNSTFSKDASVIKKGLFFQISPGSSLSINRIFQSLLNGSSSGSRYTDISPNLGIGLGLDIELSDSKIISPIIRFTRHFNVEWESLVDILNFGLPSDSQIENDTTPINQFEIGLRVGLRWKD